MQEKPTLNVRHQIWGGITFLLIAVALYLVFIWVPTDRNLGVSQKIFYFHVSAAWIGFLAFFIVFIASIAFLRSRTNKWDILAVSSAEIGVLFTTIALITGSIWGRTAWNTWWNWEPRLVTTLVLWFIYVAYLLVRASSAEEEKKGRLAAVFGIIGFFNVPIVFMSIRWWQIGLHPVVFEGGRSGLPSSMLQTLIFSVCAFTLLYFYMLQKVMALAWLRDEVNGLKNKLRERLDQEVK